MKPYRRYPPESGCAIALALSLIVWAALAFTVWFLLDMLGVVGLVSEAAEMLR